MTESFEFIPPVPPAPVRPPTPEKRTPRIVNIKANYKDKSIELELQPVSQDVYGWQALKSRLQAAFGIRNISVKYTDDAGDSVNMDTQEEYEEAIKVAQQLGTLELSVDGEPYNAYVENLHIKLSKPFRSLSQDEAMDTSSENSSPEHSFVEILHAELSKRPVSQVKFHPYRRSSSGSTGHYAELARKIGSERKQLSPTNDYIEAFQQKVTKVHGGVAEPAMDNPYVDLLHQRLSKSGGKPKMPPTLARSPVVPKPNRSSSAPSTSQSPFKNEYVESLDAKLKKMGTNGRQPVAPSPGAPAGTEWWVTELEKTSNKIIGEVHRGLEGTVEILVPPTGSAPPVRSVSCSNVIHYNITCDGCDFIIKGARYKCGNCPNYDLCETCEQWSESIHRPDHVFLKIKIPAAQAGLNRKGKLRPLLKRNLYQFTCHTSDEEEVPEKTAEHLKRQHRHHHHHRRHREGHSEEVLVTSGYVLRSKDKLKEEVRANKMKKKEEKQKAKIEKKVEKLGTKLAATSVSSPPRGERQRGHGKYLDCQFITDTCYPDDSLVPFKVPFEKGWLVMNSGTKKWKHVKLVHTDGFRPLCPTVDVPELKPGERVELIAKFPPITDVSVDSIKSSWRLVHKESTAFGPLLWLQVRVDKAPLFIYPPTITVPAATPSTPEQSLTNENLLKSIGFIPGNSASGHAQSSGEEEELLTTFDVVETPKDSVHSFSSYSSIGQPPLDFQDVKMDDTASVASDDSDFVVVIPDCFDLDKPLPGFSSIRSTTSLDDPTASIKSRDSHVTSKDDTVPPKVEAPPPRPAERSPPSSSETSPETVRKMTFVPQRITLRQVKDSRLYRNPITMATGLVNTVTDLVDKRVHFGPKKSEEAPPKEESESDSDDSFEDAPEAPGPAMEATPSAPPKSEGTSDVREWVKSEDSEDMRRWCHNPDVSHLLPLRWDGPKAPSTPMDRLIGMGFADRQLNTQLLEKHNNNLTAVLNELLDGQRQAYGRGSSQCAHV